VTRQRKEIRWPKPGYQNTPIQETKRTRNQQKTSQHRAKSNRLNGNQPTAGEGVRQKQKRGGITRNPESGVSQTPSCTSYTLDHHRPLAVQLVGIAGMRLLLAVFQTRAGMGLEHAVLRAEVAVAKAAVTDDPLGSFLALLEVATGLSRSHGCGCEEWRD
jgi:hypothetical protein